MQPNGFSVDIGWQTHNDITRPHYLPVLPPEITADGDWIPLVQDQLGRFRSTVSGKVLFSNSAYAQGGVIPIDKAHFSDISISSSAGDLELEIDEELHGKGSEFGERFWDLLLDRHKGLVTLFETEEITKIHYSDRYLNTPLGAALLLQVLKELDTRYPNSYGRTKAHIKVEQIRPDHRSYRRTVWDDWLVERDRERAIEAAFEYVGLTAEAGTYAKPHMPHFRVLEFQFSSGKAARIRLDEGWGYWEAGSAGYGNYYDFSANADDQGKVIAMWSGTLAKRRKNYKTAFFLSIRT